MEFVVNFSGGKDSCAMLAWLCERYPHVPKHVVMADTGWEHVEMEGRWPSAEQFSEGIAALHGFPLHVVRNPNKTFLEMVDRRGMFPSKANRQCTSDLKRDPIKKWIRHRWWKREAVIINCMGLRAEESPDRAKKKCLSYNAGLSKSGREVWDWNPILGWTEHQVYDYLAEREIPVHPVYHHLKRLSCRVCIFMSKPDLRAVAEHDPEALDQIAMLEEKHGFTMRGDGGVRDAAVSVRAQSRTAQGDLFR